MKLRLPILVPRKATEETFKADIRFKTKASITPRTVKISEAFGIGTDDEHEFVIYDDFALEVNRGDIVYITGDSGSGKSLLLKKLASDLANGGFGRVIIDREIERQIDPEKTLIDQVSEGKDLSEAIKTLSLAGLNEAFLMIRKYPELSDGQKYRFKLAKMIDSNADVWVMDEFLALLDRTTAKVVAYTIQKTARKLQKTVIVATTHTDLDKDLNPNVRIFKHFGFKVDVDYRKVRERPCSLLERIVIEKGSKEDFRDLEQFHYRHGMLSLAKDVYRAVLDGKVVGIIIYGPSYPNLSARRVVLPMFSKKMDSKHLKMINKNFIRIWRVVDPKYRSIGLGIRLVRETLEKVGYPYVEIMAVMGQYNPFAERAGMVKVPIELYSNKDAGYVKALLRIQEMGFDLDLLRSRRYNLEHISKISRKEFAELKVLSLRYFLGLMHRRKGELVKAIKRGSKDAVALALANHRLPYSYAIWKNPKFRHMPDPVKYRECCNVDK
ncbi:MAG: ATP-binding cassette domain-containing protein [Nitrososphaerales archaeon]